MYLLELNDDGLVKDDIVQDNWKAIKEFRDVYEKHGIKGLTVVSLFTDYNSPLSYFIEKDRFLRSVEEIYGSRNKLKKDLVIDAAIAKYSSLQYNPDLEHCQVLQDYKIRILEKIKLEMSKDDPESEAEIVRLNGVLQKHETSSKSFYEKFEKQEIINTTAVTSNGYQLSRIETDLIKKKNSKFANEGKNLINPNKLNLN